jgi:hypothetical protein
MGKFEITLVKVTSVVPKEMPQTFHAGHVVGGDD